MRRFLSGFLRCIFVCACFVFGAIDYANAIAYPFSITTTNIPAGGTFTFKLSASGSFDVLCGDGGTLSGTSVSGIRINKSNDTNNNTYTCTYSTGGVKTIQFGVWDVLQYNATEAAISFASNYYVASISGSLSALFPYRDVSWNQAQNRRPNFKNSFYGCTNLTSISDTLFSGYTGGVANMFYFTFGNCSKLTSIPENLFSSITTGASQMFYGTFLWDRQITGYVPPTLFSGLIANGSPMPDMMTNIFALNSQMATSCPTGMQQYITGYEAYWTDVVSCEPARSEITYDCGVGGGTAPTGDTVMYGASFTPAANSCTTPVGYTDFVGWAVSDTNDIRTAGTQFTWEYEGNKTLTAQWTPMDYTVSFAAGTHGSGSMSSQTKYFGDTVTLPANSFTAANGYKFTGWNCNNNIGDKGVNETFTMPAANVTCTAQWTPVYTVTYSCSNGTGTPIDSNSPYIGGATVTALTSSACTTLPGDHFNYWDCGSVGGVSSGGTFTMPSANVTCMAAWIIQLFGVRFAAGTHGSGNMPSYTSIRAREQITLPANSFAVTNGYQFTGWNCNNNIGDKAVGETFSMPAADVTCTAQYTAIDYTVSFAAGTYGSGSMSSQTNKHVGDRITLPSNEFTPSSGYIFNGWSCDNNVGSVSSGGYFPMPAANVTCTAQWTAIDYTVSFAQGAHGSGSMSSQTNKHVNDTITLPANEFTPSSGYGFNGWNCNNNIGDKAVGETFSMPAADVTCTAQWTPKNITLNWYNGNTKITPSNNAANNCTYDDILTIPSNPPSKTGYVFAGWTIKTGGGTGGGLLCGLTDNILITGGTSGFGHGYYNNGDYCQVLPGGDEVSCSATGLSLNEWKAGFDHGIMRGIASCNNTPGPDMSALESQIESQAMQIYEAFEAGTITEEEAMAQFMALQSQVYTLSGATASSNSMSSSSTGQYCWCKMESYTPNGGNACNVSASSAWVFTTDYGSADDCAWNCAFNCSGNALDSSTAFRRALAEGAGN